MDNSKFDIFQKSVWNHFSFLWNLAKGKTNKELNNVLCEQGKSDEEVSVIRDVCSEIDFEHDMSEEIINEKKDPGEWLEAQITNAVKAIIPEATNSEVTEVVNSVADAMENEIGRTSDELTSAFSLDDINYNREAK